MRGHKNFQEATDQSSSCKFYSEKHFPCGLYKMTHLCSTLLPVISPRLCLSTRSKKGVSSARMWAECKDKSCWVWFLATQYMCSLPPPLPVQHWFWANGLWAGWLSKLLEFSVRPFSQGQPEPVLEEQRLYCGIQGHVRLRRAPVVGSMLHFCFNFDVAHPTDLKKQTALHLWLLTCWIFAFKRCMQRTRNRNSVSVVVWVESSLLAPVLTIRNEYISKFVFYHFTINSVRHRNLNASLFMSHISCTKAIQCALNQ